MTCRITIATLLSFLSGALAQTHKFCYSAVASSSVVLILPVGSIFSLSPRFLSKHTPPARALSCSVARSSFLPAILSLGLCAFAMPSCTRSSLVSDSQSAPKSMRGCRASQFLGQRIIYVRVATATRRGIERRLRSTGVSQPPLPSTRLA